MIGILLGIRWNIPREAPPTAARLTLGFLDMVGCWKAPAHNPITGADETGDLYLFGMNSLARSSAFFFRR